MKTHHAQHIKLTPFAVAVAFTFSVIASMLLITGKANAVALEEVMVRFDNITVNTATTGTVCASTPSSVTETEVHVTFPTGYSLGAAGTFTVSTTNLSWPSGAAAWPGINTATAVNSQEVTFPSTTLTPDTLYCFNWTNSAAVTTQGSASSTNTGSVETYIAGPTLQDSTEFVTQTVNDGTIDVTATVPQAFSFALSANTDPLGSLSTGSVTESPTPRTVTINTNAQFGWMVWAREDATAGLASTSASYALDSTAGVADTLSPGTEGYITGVSDSQGGGTGTITVAAAFDYDGADDGAGLDNTLRTLASSDGTADTAVLTIRNQAAISGITPAATDYSDTITFTGAGIF